MATKHTDTPNPADDAQGAGTTATPEAASDAKDAKIAALEAQLAAAEAKGTLAQIQASQAPAPATFSAPSAPLVAKYDTLTQLTQQLPQKLWDVLSDEDKERFTPYTEQAPAPLATA